MVTTIVLARHGRTAWHSPNRYAGRSDIPIDSYGRMQAQVLARWAVRQEFTGLARSNMLRAKETLAPTAEATGLPVISDTRLRELDFGVAEGRTLEQLRAEEPEAVAAFERDPVAHHFPGGESPITAVARALAAFEDLRLTYPDGRILVVAHSTLIRLVTCDVLGIPLREYRRRLPRLDPLGTVTLDYQDVVALLAYNVPVTAGGDTLAP
jgi:probable phosphoglycerate mutase